MSAQCEAGNVKIVRGLWNDDFLRELENFPDGRHDDAIDALSGAHSLLAGQCGPEATVVHGGRGERERWFGPSCGFDWPDDHPFRPRGTARYPLL